MNKPLKGMLIAIAFLVLSAPTIIVLSDGGFYYSEQYMESSPNGDDHLVILKRTAFPANEFVDPSIIIKLKLSGKSDDVQTVRLLEDSDLIKKPTAVWKADSVTISNLSTRRKISIRLQRRTLDRGN